MRFAGPRRGLFLLAEILAILSLFPVASRAQVYGTDAHNVTVQVLPITLMGVSQGTVLLNITSGNAVAGEDRMTVTDRSTRLLWGTNASARKVTASSSLASPRFTLLLLALDPTRGSAGPEFALSAVPHDLLLGVGRSSGWCTLQYTAVALASQGTGTETHIVTFTVQAQ